MRKLLFKALFFSCAFLFFSCSSDDGSISTDLTGHVNQNPPQGSGVTGKWKAVSYIYDGELFSITDVCRQEILEIKENGTAVSTKHCPGGDFVTDFVWTHNGTDIYGFDSEATYFPVTYHLTFPERQRQNVFNLHRATTPQLYKNLY